MCAVAPSLSPSLLQADYCLDQVEEVAEINRAAARLAKKATAAYMADYPGSRKFVAGAIGPTNKTLSVSPSVENPAFRGITYDEVVDAYYDQAAALYDGGVDLFLVETIFDTLNAKAAIFALEKFFGDKGVRIPVMISGTIVDNSGRTVREQWAETGARPGKHGGTEQPASHLLAHPVSLNLIRALPYPVSLHLNHVLLCSIFCVPPCAAERPDQRGLLEQRAARQALRNRPELRPGCQRHEEVHRQPVALRRLLCVLLPQRWPAQRHGRL